MANSRSPADTAINPTRQMLDELDALMERMLSLPVEEPVAQLGPPQSPLEPARLESQTPVIDHVSMTPRSVASVVESQPALQPVPVESPLPPLQGPHLRSGPSSKIIVGRLSAPPPYAPPADREPDEKKVQANEPVNEEPVGVAAGAQALAAALPPLILKPALPRTAAVPVRRSPLQWGFKRLLDLNQAFDRATLWLGGTGRQLRSARGRLVLGLAGVVLLALATLWCLHDWLGWNWFQVSLE